MAKPGETAVEQTATAKAEASSARPDQTNGQTNGQLRDGQITSQGDDQQVKDQAQRKLSQDATPSVFPGRLVSDQVEGRRGNFASNESVLTPEQIQMLNLWRGKANQIKASNSANARDGGADIQNGVYKLAAEELKKQHLDEKGWEALPVQDHSPLDKIGADIVLVNRQSGDIIFLDPSSRRLDPRTGERLSSSESAKNNVPALRQDGVVDALPGWFDKMSGNLKTDDPHMKGRIATFAEDFSFQIAELTRTPSPFNLKDFPLPSPTGYAQVKDAKGDLVSNPAEIAEIKAVSTWSNKKASEVQGENFRMAGDYKSYAQTVDAALNYTRREKSGKLGEAFHRNAAKVIVEDAIAQVYPNQVDRPINSKPQLNLGDGNRIVIDNLTANISSPAVTQRKYSELKQASWQPSVAIRPN